MAKREYFTEREAEQYGLGDLVADGMKMLGVKPCKGCRKRKKALNRVRLPARWKKERCRKG